jgi:hypothetical protein
MFVRVQRLVPVVLNRRKPAGSRSECLFSYVYAKWFTLKHGGECEVLFKHSDQDS